MTVLSWAEKEKLVIELYNQGVNPKEIAHRLRMSLRDVYRILKPELGKKKTELTNELKAVKLYIIGKLPVDAAIRLRIPLDEAMQYFIKYNDTMHLGKFGKHYNLVKGKGQLDELLDICEAMKIENMTVKDMVNAYQMTGDLAEREDRLLIVARDTEFYEGRKNTVLSELEQLRSEVVTIKSYKQDLNAELVKINAELVKVMNLYQAYGNQNQNNSNFPNYGYSNNYPYYNPGYNYGNVRYW